MQPKEFNVTFKVFTIFEEDNIPFPEPDSQLFVTRDDTTNASIFPDWETYVIGYAHAANVLIGYVGQSGIDSDILVFPIVFLFRQHLELQIKSLLLDARGLLGLTDELKLSHDLRRLWADCAPLLIQVFGNRHLQEFGTIEKLINQFSAIDPNSEGFRYPIDKKGNSSFPANFDNLNLGHMAKVLNGIAVFLDQLNIEITRRIR